MSAIKVATMKITDDLHYKWKPSHKIDTLWLAKQMNGTQREGTGKSMKTAII